MRRLTRDDLLRALGSSMAKDLQKLMVGTDPSFAGLTIDELLTVDDPGNLPL